MVLVLSVGGFLIFSMSVGFNEILVDVGDLIKRKDWWKILRLSLFFIIPSLLLTTCIHSCVDSPSIINEIEDNPYQGSLEQATDLGIINERR